MAAPAAPSARDRSLAGLAAHRAGDLKLAERLYRESLQLSANDPDVLHMLGVTRMQQYDYDEARRFIEQAGNLVGWSHPDLLHNRAHLLSVCLSGRAANGITERINAMNQRRLGHRKQSIARVAIVVVSNDDRPQNLQSVGAAAGEVQVFPVRSELVNGVREGIGTAVRRTVVSALNAAPDVVLILHESASLSQTTADAVSRFVVSGADWGILSAEELTGGHVQPAQQRLHRALVARLKNTSRVGMALLDDNQLHAFLEVGIYRAEYLRETLDSVSFESATDLAFDLLKTTEPIFLTERANEGLGAGLGEWWRPRPDTVDRYINWALDTPQPLNPLAPCVATDGLNFLKRPLRVWVGRFLAPSTLDRIVGLVDARAPIVLTEDDGVEYIGFARAESGLGESLRLLVRATTSVGMRCSVGDVVLDVGMRQADTSVSELIVTEPKFRKRIVCVNPDSLGESLALDGHGAIKDEYKVGYWYWELERIPQRWADSARLFQEIWVASPFVADAVRAMCDTPVQIITPPLLAPPVARSFSRAEYGLDDKAYVFLFSFAYGSFATRKNPEAVLRAFRAAFPRSIEHVQLVVKTSQSELFQEHVDAIASEVGGDPRIVFINKTLSREQLTGLQSVADCYVSLHRSEGLGLGMAESMSLGKPTIGTGYSGNLAFMNEQNSLLVDYRLVPIKPGEYIDSEGQSWADASIEDAARKMRHVFENQSEARRLGERARAELDQRFSLSAVGARIRAALQTL